MKNVKKRGGKIIFVEPEGLADELGLTAGDEILAINGTELRDLIDLSFAMADEEIDLTVRHADGEEEIISFDKDIDEELGAEFESAVFDGIRACGNRCYFCFVDQVPQQMRSALYIKDDDYRLSFLYGNFVTLTNIREQDFQRIARYHLSPLHISVQTVNPELRVKLLGSPRANELNSQLDRLADDGIEYHAQVVLCPGINDGAELERTITELWQRRSSAMSLAIVPVGLTKFREGCYPLTLFDSVGAGEVIDMVSKYQKKYRNESGENFVYLGDEFYLMAGRELPPAEEYDGFPQLDNGIGLARSFLDDWNSAKEAGQDDTAANCSSITILTGEGIAPLIGSMVSELSATKSGAVYDVVPVVNEFFGDSVNVSGLLTGKDIRRVIDDLRQQNKLQERVIIPASCLRAGDNIFLDDDTLDNLTADTGLKVLPVLHGDELFEALNDFDTVYSENTAGDRTSYMWQSNAAYTKL
ncbi:MAG: DUF512 domain-containing protein [Selenomonadaceae bacterium]|nr:DUF512 domain-containing protein [Selenomonadaceae bacterium]